MFQRESSGRGALDGTVRVSNADVSAPAGARSMPRPRNNFDGLRLLGSVLVVYGHLMVDRTGTGGLRILMFFAISGFLVTGSWIADPHPGRFLLRRFLRIWPAYAALVVVCAAASWAFPAPDMPEVSRLASLFYLSNLWSPGFDWGFFPARFPMMNRSIWMLPHEVDLYLAFVPLALLGRRARIGVAVAVLLIAWRAPQTPFAYGHLFESWSLSFAGFFAFGVLLHDVRRLRATAIVLAFVLSGAFLLWCGEREAGLLLVIPPAVVWVGERSWFGLRSAARFGDLSLGIFLWSFPVQQVTSLWIDPATSATVHFLVVLAQLVPIAWLSCRYVERPALRWKPTRPTAEGRYAPKKRTVPNPASRARSRIREFIQAVRAHPALRAGDRDSP